MLGERVTSLNKSLQAGAKRLERKQVKEDDFPSARKPPLAHWIAPSAHLCSQ